MTRQRRLFEDAAVRRKLTERYTAGGDGVRIDRAAAVIHDCALLGKVSANQRVYEDSALDKAVELYEGKIVRVNHKPGEKRSVCEDIGALKNIRREGDKVRGDFHYIQSHPLANYFVERAEKFPHTFGFSHEADGLVEDRGDDIEHVVDLVYVESVDLVGVPATNSSLFEEKTQMVRKSIRSIIRGVPAKTPGRKRMVEMIDDPATAGDVEVEKDATPEEQLDAALKETILSITNDSSLSPEEKIAKIAELVGTPVQEEDNPEPAKDPEKIPESEPEEKPETKTESGDPKEVDKITEAVEKRLRATFQKQFDEQSKTIVELREENESNKKKIRLTEEERSVRKAFVESGITTPTDEQIGIAMSLSGRARESYIGTVKELVESTQRGGEARSSGSSFGAGDFSSFPKDHNSFVQAIKG